MPLTPHSMYKICVIYLRTNFFHVMYHLMALAIMAVYNLMCLVVYNTGIKKKKRKKSSFYSLIALPILARILKKHFGYNLYQEYI